MDIPALPQTPGQTPVRRFTLWRLFKWCLAAMGVSLLCLCLCAWSLLTPPRELTRLRDTLRGGRHLGTVVQFDLGYVSTLMIRSVACLVPQIPAEGRAAVSALRRAAVGVYKLGDGVAAGADAWREADEILGGLDYHRVVSVRQHGSLVGVWCQAPKGEGGRFRTCVAVCEGGQLVLVEAEADQETLLAAVSEIKMPDCVAIGHGGKLVAQNL